MTRPGRPARQIVWRRIREWMQESGWRLCIVCGAWYGFAAAIAVGLAVFYAPVAVPYFIGAGIVGLAWVERELVMNGAATFTRRMGAWAEEWTAEELRPLRQRGGHVEHNVSFASLDADHVVVGEWGVFVIETKWTQYPVSPSADDGSCRAARIQARTAARKVRLLLTGRRQFPSTLPIQPVVMFWGPGAPKIPGGWTRVVDTIVVEGRQAQNWVRSINGDALDKSAVDSVVAQLQDHQAMREAHTERNRVAQARRQSQAPLRRSRVDRDPGHAPQRAK